MRCCPPLVVTATTSGFAQAGTLVGGWRDTDPAVGCGGEVAYGPGLGIAGCINMADYDATWTCHKRRSDQRPEIAAKVNRSQPKKPNDTDARLIFDVSCRRRWLIANECSETDEAYGMGYKIWHLACQESQAVVDDEAAPGYTPPEPNGNWYAIDYRCGPRLPSTYDGGFYCEENRCSALRGMVWPHLSAVQTLGSGSSGRLRVKLRPSRWDAMSKLGSAKYRPIQWQVEGADVVDGGTGYSVGDFFTVEFDPDWIAALALNKTGGGEQYIGFPDGATECGLHLEWVDKYGLAAIDIPGVGNYWPQRLRVSKVDEETGKILEVEAVPWYLVKEYKDFAVCDETNLVPQSQKTPWYPEWTRILCHPLSVDIGGSGYRIGDTITFTPKRPEVIVYAPAIAVVADVDDDGAVLDWKIKGSDQHFYIPGIGETTDPDDNCYAGARWRSPREPDERGAYLWREKLSLCELHWDGLLVPGVRKRHAKTCDYGGGIIDDYCYTCPSDCEASDCPRQPVPLSITIQKVRCRTAISVVCWYKQLEVANYKYDDPAWLANLEHPPQDPGTGSGDAGAGVGGPSRLTFNATQGTKYWIAVDGFNGASGSIQLDVESDSGPEDTFTGLRATGTGPGKVFLYWGDTRTDESGYKIERKLASEGSDKWTEIASVLTNTEVHEDTGLTPGGTYDYRVRGFQAPPTPQGNPTYFAYSNTATAVASSNDDFANAAELFGRTDSDFRSNVAATKQPGEPDHAGNSGGKSLWWSWTAVATDRVWVKTIGSNFDTILAVYTGSSVESLTLVASNNNIAIVNEGNCLDPSLYYTNLKDFKPYPPCFGGGAQITPIIGQDGTNESDIGGRLEGAEVESGGAYYAFVDKKHVPPILPLDVPSIQAVDQETGEPILDPETGIQVISSGAKILRFNFRTVLDFPGRNYASAEEYEPKSNRFAYFPVTSATIDSKSPGKGYVVGQEFDVEPVGGTAYRDAWKTQGGDDPDYVPYGSWYSLEWINKNGMRNDSCNSENRIMNPYPKCRLRVSSVDDDGGITGLEVIHGGMMFKPEWTNGVRHPYVTAYVNSDTGTGASAGVVVDTDKASPTFGKILSCQIGSSGAGDNLHPGQVYPVGGRDYANPKSGWMWEMTNIAVGDANFVVGIGGHTWHGFTEDYYHSPDPMEPIEGSEFASQFQRRSEACTLNECYSSLLNKTYKLCRIWGAGSVNVDEGASPPAWRTPERLAYGCLLGNPRSYSPLPLPQGQWASGRPRKPYRLYKRRGTDTYQFHIVSPQEICPPDVLALTGTDCNDQNYGCFYSSPHQNAAGVADFQVIEWGYSISLSSSVRNWPSCEDHDDGRTSP